MELDVRGSPAEAAEAAAKLLIDGNGHLALSGGSTPRPAYELAAALKPDWSSVEVWWGDERCVPPDDDRSNYRLARESILDRVAVAPRAVHRIEGELEPEEAARRYDTELRGVTLDLVLLGLGPDGHTASLFPHDAALEETERLAVAVERPDVARVTLTLPLLRAAAHVVFLVAGGDKADAARRAFASEPDPATPASLIRGRRTTVILDRAAAARLGG